MAWKQTKKLLRTVVISIFLVLGFNLPAQATCNPVFQSCSTKYGVSEVFIGSGGELNSCSADYCSKQSAGETAVGQTCSASYCAQAGFNTDRQPYIEVDVSNTNVDLGTLKADTTKTTTATFTVKTYLAQGYEVVNASPPPSNNGYVMHTDSSPTASNAGTEQFGINLVADTDPTGLVGHSRNPQQIPDSTFSFGSEVVPEYGQPNEYMYAYGSQANSEIAASSQSSGYTTYTIAYIFNISPVTPGGTYVMHHVIVATSTY